MEYLDFPQPTARPASLKNRAYEHIRQKLFNGSLREGAHLSPVELGKEIGVSHIPVREAISQLASEGLVVQIDRQGSFVRRMQRQELLELIELRGMLEAATVTKVAKRIKAGELDELEGYLKNLADIVLQLKNVDREMGGPDGEENDEFMKKMVALMANWTLHDLSFHMLLLRVGGNRQVANVFAERQIMLQMFRHRTDSPDAWDRPLSKYYEENYLLHQDIFASLRQGDAKAARHAMTAHTARAKENMLARFDWLKRQKDAFTPMAQDFPDSLQRMVQDIQSSFMKNQTNIKTGGN